MVRKAGRERVKLNPPGFVTASSKELEEREKSHDLAAGHRGRDIVGGMAGGTAFTPWACWGRVTGHERSVG